MAYYKIGWKSNLYGESLVEADSPEEARAKAMADLDSGFEQLDPEGDWEIVDITEIDLPE